MFSCFQYNPNAFRNFSRNVDDVLLSYLQSNFQNKFLFLLGSSGMKPHYSIDSCVIVLICKTLILY